MIQEGQVAPAFAGTTYKGEAIDLSAFKGKKVWLGFYRWASCPLCNLRVSELIERYAEFEKAGIQHISVFQSPAENIQKYVGSQQPPFPIIADPDMQLYGTYGVQTSFLAMLYPRVTLRAIQAMLSGFMTLNLGEGPKARVPADFLVDPEGLVWKAYYGKAISDHIPFDEVERFSSDLCLDMPDQVVG